MLKPASAPLPFCTASPSLLPAGLPANLSMATRTVYVLRPEGELQYLVFKEGFNADNDPRLNHLLGSGFTLQAACSSAIRGYDLMQKLPADYWPRLAGCTFTQRIEDGNVALQYCCVNAAGEELSHADTREESSRLALHRTLADCQDMSFEEFCAITVTAQVQPSGARTHGALFDDDRGQASVRKMVMNGFQQNNDYRQAAYAELEKKLIAPAAPTPSKRREHVRDKTCISAEELKKKDALNALVASVNKEILSMHKGFSIIRLVPQEMAWAANIITHPSNISSEQALRIGYADHLQSRRLHETLMEQGNEATLEAPDVNEAPAG